MYWFSWNFTPHVCPKLDYGWYSIHYAFFDLWTCTDLLGFTDDKKMGQDLVCYRIAGTAVLVGLTGYVVIESVRNPQSTPPGVLELAVAIEIFQISYVIITAIIIFARR